MGEASKESQIKNMLNCAEIKVDKASSGNKEFPYHPLFQAEEKGGYFGYLTEKENEALETLKAVCEEEQLEVEKWLLQPVETVNLLLLRFLRARKFNVRKALAMLKNDLAWREAQEIHSLVGKLEEEAAGCSLEGIEKFYPMHWMQGFDKQGRPVSYQRYGDFRVWECLKMTTLENMLRHHIWCNERALRSATHQSVRLKYNIETTVGVIDMEGWNVGLIHKHAYKFCKMIAETDSDHYPERLGQMVLINCPSTMTFTWKVISSWLDARQKAKIRILGGQKEYLPVLLEYIDEDQIPVSYGGTAPLMLSVPMPESNFDGSITSKENTSGLEESAGPSTIFTDESKKDDSNTVINVANAKISQSESERIQEVPPQNKSAYEWFLRSRNSSSVNSSATEETQSMASAYLQFLKKGDSPPPTTDVSRTTSSSEEAMPPDADHSFLELPLETQKGGKDAGGIFSLPTCSPSAGKAGAVVAAGVAGAVMGTLIAGPIGLVVGAAGGGYAGSVGVSIHDKRSIQSPKKEPEPCKFTKGQRLLWRKKENEMFQSVTIKEITFDKATQKYVYLLEMEEGGMDIETTGENLVGSTAKQHETPVLVPKFVSPDSSYASSSISEDGEEVEADEAARLSEAFMTTSPSEVSDETSSLLYVREDTSADDETKEEDEQYLKSQISLSSEDLSKSKQTQEVGASSSNLEEGAYLLEKNTDKDPLQVTKGKENKNARKIKFQNEQVKVNSSCACSLM